MKNLVLLLSFAYCLSTSLSIYAYDSKVLLENTSQNFTDPSPVHNQVELQLNNTDTIPDYESKVNKLKISGTIYESDGITPAKNIILFIEQADEDGDFDLRTHNDKRYVHHSGQIKTNADGQYTFYTFIPGNDRRFNQLQQLFPTIKEPSKPAYEIASFLFDEDPLLTKMCRKRIAKKDDPSRILSFKKVDGLLVAQKDIVLIAGAEATK